MKYEEFQVWLSRITNFRSKMSCSKIQVLCGMIASGKSTYAKNAASKNVLICNDDDIVNMLHADDYTLYNKELKILYKSVENHIISTGLSMGRTVLIDRGLNVSLEGRNRWLALARSFDVPCEAIVLKNEGPEIHAARRAKSDSRGHPKEYWIRVANIHNDLYVEPTIQEGFDTVHYLSFEEIQEGKVIQ